MPKNRFTEREAHNLALCQQPFRIDASAGATIVAGTTGGHEDVNGYYAVQAINADATWGGSCVKAGDTLGTIPTAADTLTQDVVYIVDLTTADFDSGVVLLYYY